MQQADADKSFVIGPDDVMRTKSEHLQVFHKWLTGPGMTPVMTKAQLEAWKAESSQAGLKE